jgi:hypothetical protein
MPFVHAQTTIGVVTNLTADYATNNTYWVVQEAGDLALLGAAIKAAYDVWRPEMSGLVRQNGHVTKFYDREDPEPRAPILTYNWNLAGAPSGGAAPPEVSVCCSFQGNPLSGQPQSRRRGRNYLPFLASASIGADGRPDAACVTAAVGWGDSLLEFSKANADFTWVVASSYGVPGEFDVVITNGWVDNEFDTQRRRGRDATARTTFD